jgi:hypothetical protein
MLHFLFSTHSPTFNGANMDALPGHNEKYDMQMENYLV